MQNSKNQNLKSQNSETQNEDRQNYLENRNLIIDIMMSRTLIVKPIVQFLDCFLLLFIIVNRDYLLN